LRDRELGTSHHRKGGIGNDFIARLNTTRPSYTPMGILESVKHSSNVFDELAASWSPGYHEHRHPLLAWITYAREIVSLQ
jgi:hypothetical protein